MVQDNNSLKPTQPEAFNTLPPTEPVAPVVESNTTSQTPQFQNTPPANPLPQIARQHLDSGLIILQWLTYAFWGWTVLALSVLTGTVLANFIADADTGSFTPYGIAAVLVLLPISFVCDYFYSKREPAKKVGAEVLVMVVHAVIFALFGIGTLIWAVISLVQLATSSDDTSAVQTSLFTALIVAVFYGATFLRTLNPGFAPWIRRFYGIFMVVAVGIIAILGITGPVAYERSTRDDRLVSNELSSLTSSISDYARQNDKLPADLYELNLEDETKQVVDKKLISYKPLGKNTPTNRQNDYSASSPSSLSRLPEVHLYELCATYAKPSKGYNGTKDYDVYGEEDGYQTYISAYSHPAGRVCYKLKTSDY